MGDPTILGTDMTTEKKAAVKKHTVNGVKLMGAIGALATAVTGYQGLIKKQNQMLYVMSTKLNALSEKVAYLDGRMAGETHEIVTVSTKRKIQPVSAVVIEPAEELPRTEVMVEATPPEPMLAPGTELVEAHSEGMQTSKKEVPETVHGHLELDDPGHPTKRKRRRPKSRIKELVYQQMPVNLEDLSQFQEQMQMQED